MGKPVAVIHFPPGAERGVVLAHFDTVQEAESFIANLEGKDPEGVGRGDYGVDAPEEMLS